MNSSLNNLRKVLDNRIKLQKGMNKNAGKTVLFLILILFAFFFIYPMIFVFINSFRPNAEIIMNPLGFTKPTFENYVRAWKVMEFHKVFFNTLMITVFGLAGIIITSSMAAYMLQRTNTKLSWILYGFFAFYLVIPFQIIMVPVSVLAADLNLTNNIGIIIMYWGLGCPTAIFMFHGFVSGIPKELEESASIDGAGKFQTFFKIILPMMKGIIATVAVIDALWIWNDYLLPMLIIKDGTIQLAQMKLNGQFLKEYGPLCASLTISSIPMILFYLFLQKYIIKGIAAGAVKG